MVAVPTIEEEDAKAANTGLRIRWRRRRLAV
jgi:hypothetical protein